VRALFLSSEVAVMESTDGAKRDEWLLYGQQQMVVG
jgi:hypothetical protein